MIDWGMQHYPRKSSARRRERRLAYERLENRDLLSVDPQFPMVPSEDQLQVTEADPIPLAGRGDWQAEGESSLPKLEVKRLDNLSLSGGTGYKAQSKVWHHDGKWWAAGTKIWRLDGTSWTEVLKLTSGTYRTDVKSHGDLVHVLLFPDGRKAKLATAEYVPEQQEYRLWSKRPEVVDVPLTNSVRLATLDLDSAGRMWVAADTDDTIEVHYSEPESNYSTWNGPITIGTGVTDGDISVVTTMRNGSIGVLWSNQVDDRFYFREHLDFNAQGQRNDPAAWEPLEIPAENAAQDQKGGIADDHLNVAVAADGTLYAGVKTSYDSRDFTEIGALVRAPDGLWHQELYDVSNNGTRPIIVLNEVLGHLMVIYDDTYHESLTDPVAFGSAKSLPLDNNVTSTKDNWTNELVILGGSKAVMITTDAVVNAAPVATADTYAVDEDGVLDVLEPQGVLSNDTDAENDPLTAAVTGAPSHGSLTLGGDGSFTYTPDSNYHGSDSFRYQVSDGVNPGVTGTVSITVNPVNDPPAAADAAYETLTGQALAIPLSAVDIDGDTLAYTIANPPSGTLTGTAPDLTYSPDGFTGNDSFTYFVNDGTVDSNTATVTIEVRSNAAPVADDQTLATDEDTALPVTLTGSDADGDPLSFTITAGPAGGTLSGTAPDLTYTPHANFHGPDQFDFQVNDGFVDSGTATVSITVNSVNDVPIAGDLTVTTDPDTAISLVLPGSDADGDLLTYSVVSNPSRGTLTGTVPNLTYTPDTGFIGTDVFTYQVADSQSSSAAATVSITVADPVPITISLQDGLDGYAGTRDTRLRGDQATRNHGTSTKLELDGNPDQVSLIRWDTSQIPPGSTVTSASITVNVLKTSDDDFEVYEALRAWDELSATYELAASGQPWEVPGAAGPTDHAATVLASLTGSSSGSVTIDLNADGVAVVQKWVLDPSSNLGFVIQDLTNATTDDLDISSREDRGAGPMLTVNYRLGAPPPPNDPPVALDDSYGVDEDGTLTVSVAAGLLSNDTDPEHDPLSVSLASDPAAGTLALTSFGSFTYQPWANFHGSDSFTYRAVDSMGNQSDLATVSLTVNPVNDAPVADNQTVSTSLETAVSFSLSGSDVDGDSLTYALGTNPTSGQLTGTLPDLTYTPDTGFIGSDSFTFHVNDGTLDSGTATVSVSVSTVNRPPVADDQSVSTAEDSAAGIALTGSDVDGDALSFTVSAGPSHGSLSGTAPNLSYTPHENYHGSDSFRFQVHDGELTSPPATVSITVDPINDPPVADDRTVTTIEDTAIDFTIGGTDVDLDELSYTVISGPSQGSLSGTAPNLTYTPNLGFAGGDSFTFQVHDGSVGSNVATVAITVTSGSQPETLSFQDGVFPTTAYDGTQDAGVRGDKTTVNYGGRDALWLDGNPDQTAFIRWDLSAIPSGSVVQSASITINVEKTSMDSFDLYELLVPWVEGEATFNDRQAGVPWQIAGAQGTQDRGSAVLGTVTGPNPGAVVIPLSSAGVRTIQGWIDDSTQNNGVAFQNFDNASTDDLDFSSSDSKDPAIRPKLTIEYVPAAAPRFESSASKGVSRRGDSRFDQRQVSSRLGQAEAHLSSDTAAGNAILSGVFLPSGLGDNLVSPLALRPLSRRAGRWALAETEGEETVALPSTPILDGQHPTQSAAGRREQAIDRGLPAAFIVGGASHAELTYSGPQTTAGGQEGLLSLELEAALQLIAADLVVHMSN